MSDAADVIKKETGPAGFQLAEDPTARTLDQSRREIEMLERLIESKLNGKDEVSSLLKEFNTAIVAHIRLEMSGLKELEEEKFKAINGQFSQRDLALTAAFAAQEKLAIAQQQANNDSSQRTESMTTKQLEAQGGSIRAVEKSLGDSTNDLKERIQATESRLSERVTAVVAEKTGSRGGMTAAIAAAGVLVVLLAVAVDIIVHFVK
jgi:hypothetical protein